MHDTRFRRTLGCAFRNNARPSDTVNQQPDLQLIADELRNAQDRAEQLEPITSRWPGFSTAAAYAVSKHIHDGRVAEGARPVGRKIGFTNPEMWSIYGVDEPIWAYLYDSTVVPVEGDSATCAIGQFAEPKIEPEIVLHFDRTPPTGQGPAEILRCIDWIAHGFEIVQSHYPGWAFAAADTIADSGLHGQLLLGPAHAVADFSGDLPAALEQFEIVLHCDGEHRARGRGANALGSPLLAVAHLLATLGNQPLSAPLEAGELVTTGTLTPAFELEPGQTWTSTLDGIALTGLRVRFEP